MATSFAYPGGSLCVQSGQYGQYRDEDGRYAGAEFDQYVPQYQSFPAAQVGCHFRLITAPTVEASFGPPPGLNVTGWDASHPITAG